MRTFRDRFFPAISGIAVFSMTISIFAGDKIVVPGESATLEAFSPAEEPWTLSGEYSVGATYVGEAEVRRGRHVVEEFDESDTIVELVFTPRTKYGVLRLGAEWERFSFGFSSQAQLPNTLQSTNLVTGIDVQLSESIIVRVEALPGVYGTNHFSIDTVNVPVIVGGTYIYSPDLQFILGVSVDVERKYPVLPGAGIRWKLHRQWVLDAVLPKPRLEFDVTNDLELYLGATLKQSSFRVDDEFGDSHNIPRLNNAVLTYTEIRTGVGFEWKLSPNATLRGEAGYQPYRTFDFYRANIRYREHGSAPYGMISLHGSF